MSVTLSSTFLYNMKFTCVKEPKVIEKSREKNIRYSPHLDNNMNLDHNTQLES